MVQKPRIKSIKIEGYRPFRDVTFFLDDLQVIVGANGSGKSSLFEFLRFLRDSSRQDIPPEIIAGSIGQQIFHVPGNERFWWSLDVDFPRPYSNQPTYPLRYQGELLGPIARPQLAFERVLTVPPQGQGQRPLIFMDVKAGTGKIRDPELKMLIERDIALKRPNQVVLSTIQDPALATLYALREYIASWRFYSSFSINNAKMRNPVLVEQQPILHEDGGNLSSVLQFLRNEHQEIFDQIQYYLKKLVPGFKQLQIRALGAPGQVMAYWQEEGMAADEYLTLADLADGVLRLLCWVVLCLQPNSPPLICIDEPDQGVHPRTLPLLAALFEKACERTQILMATHSSYFLTQFDLTRIAIMRKENGEAKYYKPRNSKILTEMLNDFGSEEIELLHRSDELERFAS